MEEVNPKCMTSSNRKKICEAQKFLLDGGFPTMHNFLPLKKNYKFRKVLLDGIGGSYLTSQCVDSAQTWVLDPDLAYNLQIRPPHQILLSWQVNP